jgi:hypothetical protein
MYLKTMIMQATMRSPTQRKGSPQHAPTGSTVTGRALSQIAVLMEARAAAASSRYERTGPTSAITDAS